MNSATSLSKFGWLSLELCQRFGQAVRDLRRLLPLSLRISLMSWLPGTHSALPAFDHAHHQPQHLGNLRAAIHQIAEEDHLSPFGMANLVVRDARRHRS